MRHLVFLLLLGLVACESPKPEVVFAEPLPVGSADLTAFPPRVRGEYVREGDTTRQLAILPAAVVRRQWADMGWHHRREIDSLRRASWPLREMTREGDSVRVRLLGIDTVFRLSRPALSRLRRKGGYYYLNQNRGLDLWVANRLRVHGPGLRLANFNADTTRLAGLQEADLLENGSRQHPRYLIRPTKAQQQHLLRDPTWWHSAEADTAFVRR